MGDGGRRSRLLCNAHDNVLRLTLFDVEAQFLVNLALHRPPLPEGVKDIPDSPERIHS